MLLNKISGRVFLLVAIVIFAASSPIASKLAAVGMQNPIDGRNPISFCNILLVGNCCALIVLVLVYGREWRAGSLARLSAIEWIVLIFVAILSGAIAPSLTFLALEQTNANNVVLISRIQPPLTFAFLSLVSGEKRNWWIFMGELVSIAGIVIILILQSVPEKSLVMMGFALGKGDLLALGGAIALAVANVTRKARLDRIPLGVFTIFRLAVGTIIFWILTVRLYSLSHFTDVFAPAVWQWVSIYGFLVVAGGQIVWFRGLKMSNFASVSYAGYLIPIAGILAAYFVLGEEPTLPQYIGGSVIILGAVFNQTGIAKERLQTKPDKSDLDNFIGFKGV